MALADTASLIVNLNLKGNFGSQLGRASRQLNTFDARLAKSESRAFRVGQHIGTGIKNLGRLAVVGAAAVGSIAVASLKLAGDFEAQLNTINTIARESPAGLTKIGAGIRKIARDTGTSLEDLTSGYYDLLSAGIKAADAQGVLEAANRLAIGGLGTTAETVDLLTTALNTYGLKAALATRVSDIFAKAIERGKVTAAELAGAFANVGPIAAASGIKLREVAAGFARLTATGVPASEAATDMASAITALTRKTADLKALEKQTGRNYLKLAGRKGLVFALEQLRKDALKAKKPLIELLGRKEALIFALATTGGNLDEFNKDLAAMGDAAGTAAGQMAEREKGLNFELGRLKALAKDAGITIGSKLLPKITPIFERINQAIQDNQPAIEALGDSIAGLFSKENIAAGASVLADAFKTAKEVAPIVAESARATGAAISLAVQAFKTLPKEVQALAVGALAVNKLTGGIVTTLAKGIFDQVFARGSSPANPMWVATVGGGLPGAPIPGAPPGGPGAITPAIGAGIILNKEELFGTTNKYLSKIYGADVTIHNDLLKTPEELAAKLEPFAGKRIDDVVAALASRNLDFGGSTGKQRDDLIARPMADIATELASQHQLIETGQTNIGTAVATGATQTTTKIGSEHSLTRGQIANSATANAATISGAIARNRPIITVGVHVQATQVTKSVTIQERYGSGNGSYGTPSHDLG